LGLLSSQKRIFRRTHALKPLRNRTEAKFAFDGKKWAKIPLVPPRTPYINNLETRYNLVEREFEFNDLISDSFGSMIGKI